MKIPMAHLSCSYVLNRCRIYSLVINFDEPLVVLLDQQGLPIVEFKVCQRHYDNAFLSPYACFFHSSSVLNQACLLFIDIKVLEFAEYLLFFDHLDQARNGVCVSLHRVVVYRLTTVDPVY